MDEKSGTAFCVICAREFRPRSPDVLLCPDCRDKSLDLGCAGYGWLRPDGVREKLEHLAATRKSNR